MSRIIQPQSKVLMLFKDLSIQDNIKFELILSLAIENTADMIGEDNGLIALIKNKIKNKSIHSLAFVIAVT